MNFAFRTILSLLLSTHQGVQVKEAINGVHGIVFKRGLRTEEMVLDVTLIDEIVALHCENKGVVRLYRKQQHTLDYGSRN